MSAKVPLPHTLYINEKEQGTTKEKLRYTTLKILVCRERKGARRDGHCSQKVGEQTGDPYASVSLDPLFVVRSGWEKQLVYHISETFRH